MRADACPSCGGLDRKETSRGEYECTTRRIVGMAPGVATGLGVPTPISGPCGHVYRVAVSEEACACGQYSIGRCSRCGAPLCGRHSAAAPSELLCLDCDTKRKDEAAAARQREAEQIIAAWERQVLQAVLAIPDVVDRTLRCRYLHPIGYLDAELQEIAARPVSQEEMVGWYLRYVPDPAKPNYRRRASIFGGYVLRPTKPSVWWIGDTTRTSVSPGVMEQVLHGINRAALTEDGRLVVIEDGSVRPLAPGERVQQATWFARAKRPELPIPPAPSWTLYKTAQR